MGFNGPFLFAGSERTAALVFLFAQTLDLEALLLAYAVGENASGSSFHARCPPGECGVFEVAHFIKSS